MSQKLLTTWIAAAAVLATTACATTQDPQGTQTETDATGQQSTVVEVTNNHQLLVTVQAVSSGFNQRLGQVASNDTESFELPSSANESDLRIQIEPIGSTDSYLSPQVSAAGNDVIEVTVERELGLSTVAVR